MKVVIVGAGKVGYYLTKELLSKGFKVAIIDHRQEACERIANDLNVDTICGDGSDVAVLHEICNDCHSFVAATGKDEVNFIACQLAKNSLNIEMTIARVNNPRNIEIVELFGVDQYFCSTSVFVDLIENEIYLEGLRVSKKIKNSKYCIINFVLSDKSDAAGKKIMEYKFIKDSKIVAIDPKDGPTFTPDGNTVMNAGDELYMVCQEKYLEQIWKVMVRP